MTVWKTALAFTLGLAALAFAATPAEAGLEFTDTATVGGSSTIGISGPDAVNVNGAAASLFTSQAMQADFGNPSGPGDLVTFSSSAAGTGSDLRTVLLDFAYTGTFGVVGASYTTDIGDLQYTMVVEFGAITIAAGQSVTLLQVGFSEVGDSGGYNSYILNQAITTADANGKLFIQVPAIGFNAVPLNLRDLVDSVQLTFQFTGLTTSVGINAVVNPEPGTLALFGLGFLGLAGLVRRRRRNGKGAVTAAA